MQKPAAPTVSVIVRSMARPTLANALESIAAQDYPELEVLVVAACGATHPTLMERCGSHRMRLVASERPLSRPEAANAGLASASGDWVTFLDDDDIWMPGHVTGLMAARAAAPQARVVYSYAHAVFANGRIERVGQPFSLIQLYERNFIHLSAAMIARGLISDGCRFDESLEVLEDWDFFLQCAQRTAFHFVPRATFRWHADIGTSGAGGDANQHHARFATFRGRIYAKFASSREALIERVTALLQKATLSMRDGDLVSAEAACRDALHASPNDPWALNVLAGVQGSSNRLADARATMELAASVRPEDPAIVYNLALLCLAMGDKAAAARHCGGVLKVEPGFAAAQELRAMLTAQGQAVS